MRLAHNPDFAAGMAASIRVGVEAAAGEQGYLLALGDMPQVAGETMEKVAGALKSRRAISVPMCAGRRGHPVAIGRVYRAALLALTGDRGARPVLAKNPVHIVEVPVEDEGIFVDVDTRDKLWRSTGRGAKRKALVTSYVSPLLNSMRSVCSPSVKMGLKVLGLPLRRP